MFTEDKGAVWTGLLEVNKNEHINHLSILINIYKNHKISRKMNDYALIAGSVSGVIDQGPCNSCAAHAAISTIESCLALASSK